MLGSNGFSDIFAAPYEEKTGDFRYAAPVVLLKLLVHWPSYCIDQGCLKFEHGTPMIHIDGGGPVTSVEEVSTAGGRSTETFGRSVPLLLLDLISLLLRNRSMVLLADVIERQLSPFRDGFSGEESQLVNTGVSVIVGDGVDGAVGIA